MSTDDPLLPLPPERLYRAADIAALDFATTRELAPLPPRPAVPVVLRHLGYMTSRLDRTAQAAYA
jgi:hypothetical protein